MNQNINVNLDPAAFVQQLNVAALLARCLALVAELRVADALAERARPTRELAATLAVDGEALYRVLRLLASHGFFTETAEEVFALTPAGELLRSDVEGSLHDRLRLPWQDLLWATYGKLPEAVRTGSPAFDLAFGWPFFEHLAATPELNAIFDRSMARFSSAENASIAAAYPFQKSERVLDVGGGQGGLLAAILRRHPGVAGVLFDQPQVVASPAELRMPDLDGRWEIAAGNFFQSVPSGADVYILKRIIHDWDDEDAVRILRRVRAALTSEGRLLVIDAVIRSGDAPDPNKFMDVNIMALLRGRERSEREFQVLLRVAGLRLHQMTSLPLPATVSIIEARLG